MRVLVIGGGAREHALCWKISTSSLNPEVFHWPSHPCGQWMGRAMDLPNLASESELAAGAVALGIQLVVVGPEGPLSQGLGDFLREAGIAVFGPNKLGAQLESSKAFAKDLMAEARIPTAAFAICCGQKETMSQARRWLRERGGVVVKASGLAAGKGVFVCTTDEQLTEAEAHLFVGDMAQAAETVVLEELMTGQESSLFVFVNTEAQERRSCIIGSAVDYKRLKAGNLGPNTGGMGGYAPVPWLGAHTDQSILDLVVEPTIAQLRRQGIAYQGCLYVGLMWTSAGPRVVEFNCRFGDPEAEILCLADGRDWLPMLAGAAGVPGFSLADIATPSFRPTVAVVMASHNYPFGDSSGGAGAAVASQPLPSSCFQSLELGGARVFGAGIQRLSTGDFGYGKGRMMVIVASDKTFAAAKAVVLKKVQAIEVLWPQSQWRADIANEVVEG